MDTDKVLDIWCGKYFSLGIEGIARIFTLMGWVILAVLGGFGIGLFLVLSFPFCCAGYLLHKSGFRSRW